MRNLTIGLVMLVSMSLAGSALAQDKMGGMHDNGMHKGHMMSKGDAVMMKTMMTGLNKDEKMTAMNSMKHMSKAEHEVMKKRCSMCMKDPHKALKSMKPKDVTEKMVHDHMMSGMTKAEQATMNSMSKKMTAKEKAVCMKMVENCCNYGMKHAK